MPYLSPKPPGWGCGCCSARNEPTPFLQILFTVQTPQESVPPCKSPDCILVLQTPARPDSTSQGSWLQCNYCLFQGCGHPWQQVRGSVCSSCQLRTKDRALILETGFQHLHLWSLIRWNIDWCFNPLSVTYPASTGCQLDYKYLGIISVIWNLLWVRRLSVIELC